MSIQQTLILSLIIYLTVACSSDENSNERVNNDTNAFQGYTDTLDKAHDAEQTLLQAEKARRDELQRQE
jgi:hypothetical protein